MTDKETEHKLSTAGDTALEALDAALRELGLGGTQMAFLTFMPVEGTRAATMGNGFEDSRELLAFMLMQAEQLAEGLGGGLRIIGVDSIGEG